jgi:hypothetical protein
MTDQRFVALSNKRMRYRSTVAAVNLQILQRPSAFMDKHEIRNVKDTCAARAHTISNSRRKNGVLNENASNVMP